MASMRWTIGKRIFLALTLASFAIVALFSIATRFSFERSFDDYLAEQEDARIRAIAAQLVAFYESSSSWDELRTNPRLWDEFVRPDRHMGRERRPPPGGKPPPGGRPPDGRSADLANRLQLVDSSGTHVAGRRKLSAESRSFPVEIDTASIGRILIERNDQLTDAIDIRFAARQQRSVLVLGIVVLLIAAAIAGLLARQLTRPITTLARGTRDLTAGSYDRRITVARDDELGDLARDFNSLAKTLQRNQQSRQQWVADISHELRTPLSILSGELQAVEDGVRPFDQSTVLSLKAEVARLGHLVTDLHTLTTSDEGGLIIRSERIDMLSLLRAAVKSSAARIEDNGLKIRIMLPQQKALVSGDPMRLEQLLTNLIENSIRYTASPGEIDIRASCGSSHVTISFSDSAPGVADADLPRLFERLYRVESSRNRESGGSGLGLAICEAIVAAHDGKISAHHADAGGVEIVVQLPLIEGDK